MPNKQFQTQIPDIETQARFCQRYQQDGHRVVASALSWKGSQALADALREKGVEVEAVPLGVLASREDTFNKPTFVMVGISDPRIWRESAIEMATLRDLAAQSAHEIRIAQQLPLDEELAIRQAPRPGASR